MRNLEVAGVLVFLISMLVAIPAIAQQSRERIELKAPDGRTVILKPDGTWEYKRDTPSPTPKPIPISSPEALPPNFSGDDVTTLIHQLIDLRKRSVKNEFETSAAYEARLADEKKKPLFGSRTVQDLFYLVVPVVKAEYNADAQLMTFFLPVEKNVIAELSRRRLTIEDKKTARDLSRISLYSISLGDSDDAHVFFDDTNSMTLSGESYRQGFSARVSTGVEEARRLKAGTKAILVVQFQEPYALESYLSGQLQARLVDVQFFDQQTGRVLAKLGSAVVSSSATGPTPKTNPMLDRARELYNTRRDDEALGELRRVVIDEPTSAEAYLLTGRIHLQRGDQEAAIAALKTAVFWDPKLIDAYILLGRLFLARGDRAEAKKYVTAALVINPASEEALSLQRQISR